MARVWVYQNDNQVKAHGADAARKISIADWLQIEMGDHPIMLLVEDLAGIFGVTPMTEDPDPVRWAREYGEVTAGV